MPESWYQEYWRFFAEAFIHPMTSHGQLARFVSNPNVTGAYAEAYVKRLVRQMSPGLRVSTGAVIRAADQKAKRPVPQVDLILWDPSVLPALFEEGDFALVPNLAVRGIIEIKRTGDLGKTLEQLREHVDLIDMMYRPSGVSIPPLGVFVEHATKLFPYDTHPEWLTINDVDWSDQPPMTRLMDPSGEVDVGGVWALIYYLSQVSGHGLRSGISGHGLRSGR